MARKTGQITELLPDGKAQITVEYEDGRPVRLDTVIVSAQHHEDAEIERVGTGDQGGGAYFCPAGAASR